MAVVLAAQVKGTYPLYAIDIVSIYNGLGIVQHMKGKGYGYNSEYATGLLTIYNMDW